MVMQEEEIPVQTFDKFLADRIEELAAFIDFRRDNPQLLDRDPLELENAFLQARTDELSGETLPPVIVGGVDEENILERNRLLHERLRRLKLVPVIGGPTVGERLAGRTEFGGGFLFPAITEAFEQDPSSNAALFSFVKQLFTSPIGIPEEPRARSLGISISDLPAPLQPFVRTIQETLSPGGIATSLLAPGIATKFIHERGPIGLLARRIADVPQRRLVTTVGRNFGENVAEQLDLPPELQAIAGFISGLGGRQGFRAVQSLRRHAIAAGNMPLIDAVQNPAIRKKVIDELGEDFFKDTGTAAMVPGFRLLFDLAQGEEQLAMQGPPRVLAPVVFMGDPGPRSSEQDAALADLLARHPGFAELSPLELENEFLTDQIAALGGDTSLVLPFGRANDLEGLIRSRNQILRQRFLDAQADAIERLPFEIAEQQRIQQELDVQIVMERQRREAELAEVEEELRPFTELLERETERKRIADAMQQSAVVLEEEEEMLLPFRQNALTFANSRRFEAEEETRREQQRQIRENLDSAIRMDQEETATAAREQLARLNETRLTGSQLPVLSPNPTEPSRISNTTRVGEGFGFGTRGANALAEAREMQDQERARLADLPPSARRIGATDLAAEVAAETQLAAAKQAEEQASATRQVSEIAAAQAESDAEASREAVRTAPTAREAVDRMDASREAEVRADRLRESARIAEEEERMLRDMRIRAQRLANDALAERRRREAEALAAAQEAARTEQRRIDALALAAANTTEVSSTSPFAASPPPERVNSFGFGTGAGDRLQAARDAAQARQSAPTATRPRLPNFPVRFEEENG